MRQWDFPPVRRRAAVSVGIAVGLAWAVQAVAVGVPPDLFGGLQWRNIGPFRGGRAVAVGGVAGVGSTFYFGAVDGGVWRTDDAGTVWKPVFDAEPVASIGALAVSASNPNVLYVGTGESDIRSDLASGAGVYKSVDGGATWSFAGLAETRQISKIVIDPADSQVVYVGALGHAYGPNAERGVYKSVDGGTTWQHTLDKGPTAGVADLAIAVSQPKILFAALWDAHRPPWSTYAPLLGTGSGLYRSRDGGDTWEPCVGHGLPEGTWGRSGVAVSADGRHVYALIAAKEAGLYASHDGGDTWARVNDDERLTSRAWYFSRISVDPSDSNTLYMPNIALLGSVDGGKTLSVIRGAPGGDDYHELWVDPKNRDRLVLGTDQGTSVSLDRGATWSTWYNQPTAQLYHVTTDERFPYTVYGAQQDSGGVAVPSRTDHGQITPRDWITASGSESGYFALDPKDPDIVYVSNAYGGAARWDRRRSLTQDISPWPVAVFGTDLNERKYRAPWTPPLAFSPVDKVSLYLGTQYVLKTVDGGLHWTQISPDLTGSTIVTSAAKGAAAGAGNASAHNALDGPAAPTPEAAVLLGYGTLATVAPSYRDKNVIWAGSDTGVVSVTRNGGKSWANVSPAGIAPWSKISLIEPSHFDAAVAYAAVERHRMDDRAPYVFRTRDYGQTWETITTGLAAPAFVLAVREDPVQKGLLYAGTEFGVAVSFDAGDHWQSLQLNLPATSVRDLTVHGADLVIATHGRSFWILDDVTALRQAAAHAAAATAFLYRPAAAVRVDNDVFPGTPLPPEEPTAPNPPNGALLDYYLPVAAQSLEIGIYDAKHSLVQSIDSQPVKPASHPPLPIAERWFPEPLRLPTSPGMHRFVWNLAAGGSAVPQSDEPDDGEGQTPHPPRAVPGAYTVQFTMNGQTVSTEPLVVLEDPRSPATPAQLRKQFDTASMIYRDTLDSRRALAEIGVVKERLEQSITQLTGENKPGVDSVKTVLASIDSLLAGSAGLDAANTELATALNAVESSDRTAPSQALAVYALARNAVRAKLADWSMLKKVAVGALNRDFEAEGLPPIEIAAIERDVYEVMTR